MRQDSGRSQYNSLRWAHEQCHLERTASELLVRQCGSSISAYGLYAQGGGGWGGTSGVPGSLQTCYKLSKSVLGPYAE